MSFPVVKCMFPPPSAPDSALNVPIPLDIAVTWELLPPPRNIPGYQYVMGCRIVRNDLGVNRTRGLVGPSLILLNR